MKLTLSWLKIHLATDASLDTIVETLTRIGLEVEGVENPGEALAPFVIAKVLTAEPHPQADKLRVLSVDAGDGPVQVVCGAPNARAGLVGVFGPPGAHVPGSGITLKVAAIRGVESRGMMCSFRELELGQEHDGIIDLPAEAAGAVGRPYADYAGLTDPVIDINVLPNRPDCMGVRGIARDLAAAGLGTLRPLAEAYRFDVSPVEGDGEAPAIRTDDPDGCPAFYAQAVSDVTNGPAPDWMARRLTAVGQKPISALVDITNFVSIDLGRPLHVYDRARLTGPLVARRARDGETLLALNGKAYALDDSITVLADDAGVHGVGGVIGGEASGAQLSTTDVLIECAFFDRERIARTGQKLALTTDARQRFERGVDPAFMDTGLAIATRMVMALCGGTPGPATRAGQPPAGPAPVTYDPRRALTLGGIDVAADRQRATLESIGFSVADDWQVTPPSWRPDFEGAADIVEEIVRMEGMDAVPATPLPRVPGVARPTATPEQKAERRLRRAAAARGLDEAVTWSFIAERDVAPFGDAPHRVANPISEDLKVMRPSLLPGLLAAAARNQARGAGAIRLFEIGRRYLADGEHPTLGLVLAGDKRARAWATGKAAGFDAFDAKAELTALLAQAGAPVANLQAMDGAGDHYHPGRSGTLRLGPKTVLGTFGLLHPAVAAAFDLSGDIACAELYLDALPARRGAAFARAPYAPPALQPVTRDFAFLVPEALAADQLVRAVKGADKATITDARLFDVFTGQGVPAGSKSLAVEVTLQPRDKSFTDADLKALADRIVAAAAKLGADLRG